MQYFTGTTEIHIREKTAITLGKFDGLHRGHQALMERVLACKAQGMLPAVFTFDMSPVAVMAGNAKQPMLLTNEERRKHLEQIGIEALIEYPFTLETSRMPAETFVEEVLVKQLHVGAVIIGTDFHFGYQRGGDAELLSRMSEQFGFYLEVLNKLKDEETGRVISSTFVREELESGRMEKVNALLGYPYAIEGVVVDGNHLGSRIGFPTANLVPSPKKKLPPNGVYASYTWIDGKRYPSVTNLGRKPTVGDYPIGAETFIYDWNVPLYGKKIQIELVCQLRPEQKFSNIEELKKQVEQDKKTAWNQLKSIAFEV